MHLFLLELGDYFHDSLLVFFEATPALLVVNSETCCFVYLALGVGMISHDRSTPLKVLLLDKELKG
jgi:hypothetical protein